MQIDKEKIKNEFKKRLYTFILRLIHLIEALPNDNTSRRLGDQLLRSGTSIIGNYVEAQAASSKKDFTNFFSISLKSANESKLWLALLRDTKKITTEQTAWFLRELDEVANILGSSVLTLKGRKK